MHQIKDYQNIILHNMQTRRGERKKKGKRALED